MKQKTWHAYLLFAAALVVVVGAWQIAIGNTVNGVLAIVIAVVDLLVVFFLVRGKHSKDV